MVFTDCASLSKTKMNLALINVWPLVTITGIVHQLAGQLTCYANQ